MNDVPIWDTQDLRLLFTTKVKGSDPIHINCLFHSEDSPSLAIWSDHAYCFGCGKWASYFEMVDKVGKEPPEKTETEEKIVVPTETEIYELANTYHDRLYKSYKSKYYYDRGLTEQTIRAFKLGYTGHAYSIPIWNWHKIKTIRFRRDDSLPNPPKSKYWGIKGLNEPFLFAPRGFSDSTLWVEGEFDALIGLQLGRTAITITNGVSANKEWVIPTLIENGVKYISLCLDRDTPSFGKTLELTGQLLDAGFSVKVVKLPFGCKDLSEAFIRYGKKCIELL